MPLAPVDYGPAVHPDEQGVSELMSQQAAVFRGVHELGSVVEGGAQQIAQGILHTQAMKATAAVKERQANTLAFIDSNPYVDKTALQQKMSPEDYSAWHDSLGAEYKDADAVPMFTAAGALFDSSAKQARADAGDAISLPGWRAKWAATEQTESATIRERYVNRIAADQMIADQRGQTLLAVDKMADSAVKPEDLDAAAKMAETSPWLKPAERRFTMEKMLAAKDSFVARQALLGGDTDVMAAELKKLRGPDAAALYPNMNVKQRLDLVSELTREHGFKAAKDTAETQIVGPNVDENGKVNHVAIDEALVKYNGPNKEDVTKAVKSLEKERTDIFDAKMADVQRSVLTAGQDPLTGRFSYARAMQNPDARKAAYQLNRDAPGLITALSREDQRWDNIDAKADAVERRLAQLALIKASGENLEKVHRAIDDPAQSDELKGKTRAQFDVWLYNMPMTEPDRKEARAYFDKFQKNGGPDERAIKSVNAEIAGASGGDPTVTRRLIDAYQSKLLEAAHKFIRDNSTLKPDELTDALRTHLRGEMMSGKVVGSSGMLYPDDRVPRIEWETNPKYQGKNFQLRNGTVLRPPSGKPVVIKGDEDFNGLAVGAHYVGPDGVERVK